MLIGQAIERGFVLINWLASELNGLPLEASPRNQLSAACFSVAQDHHTGVIVLLERELFASALALVRTQFEAYVKGVWLAFCASDQQLNRFSRRGDAPPIGTMLNAVETVEAYRDGQLSRIKSESWKAMCSFTHTGRLQMERWIGENSIGQNYPQEELVQAANFTGSIALLAGIGISTLTDQPALAQRLLERAREHARDGCVTSEAGIGPASR